MRNYYSPIIITGMHRSGTTLLSKILEDNGVFMGKYKESNNESKFFLRINRWMLSTIGASWDNPKSFNNINDDTKNLIINRINNIIESRLNFYYFGINSFILKKKFNNYPNQWGWKDPRNTFTLEIWSKLFPESKIINIERHPLDSSLSLLKRQSTYREIDKNMKNKFYYPLTNLLSISHSSLVSSTLLNNIDDCLKLTKKYILESKKNQSKYNKNIINVTYEDLLIEPIKTITAIFRHCNVIVTDNQIKQSIKYIDSSNINKYKNEKLIYESKILDELGYND